MEYVNLETGIRLGVKSSKEEEGVIGSLVNAGMIQGLEFSFLVRLNLENPQLSRYFS